MKPLNLNDKNTEDREEHSFFESRSTIFILVVLEISFFIKGYLYCSPLIKANSFFFPFVKTYHQDIAEVNFLITNLTSINRFIKLDVIFYRYFKNITIMEGDYNLSIEFLSNNQRVAYNPNLQEHFSLPSYSKIFNYYPQTIFNEQINNFDSIRSNITIKANLTELKGMSFDYLYINPSFVNLYANLSIVLTILSVFSLVRFIKLCYPKHFKYLSTNDKFLFSLNILAVLSSIDYEYFFNGTLISKFTIFLSDILIVVFRIYTLNLIDSLINHSNTISEPINAEIIRHFIFFVALIYHDMIQFECPVYARVDERPRYQMPMIRLIVLFFHIWYILLMSFYLRKARKDSSKYMQKKASLYGKYIKFNMVNTFIVEVVLMFHYIRDNTALNLFVYRFSHIFITVILTIIRIESKDHIDEYQKVNNEIADDKDNALFPLYSDDERIVEEEEDRSDN